MRCSEYAQGKDQQDDIDEDDSDVQKYVCRNGEPGVRFSGCPRDPHHYCGNTSHAETEHNPRHVKPVAPSSIQLEDGLVRNGANHVEKEEDSRDGYVRNNGGTATDQGNAVREVWRLHAR